MINPSNTPYDRGDFTSSSLEMSRWRFLKETFKWFLTVIRWTSKFRHQLSLAWTQNSSHLHSVRGHSFQLCCLGNWFTAFSRKVGKIMHATIPKGNMAICSIRCSWHCSCRAYFCYFSLALANKCPWPLLPLFQISAKNREPKTTQNTFRDRRVHFFPTTFLEIAVYKTSQLYHFETRLILTWPVKVRIIKTF